MDIEISFQIHGVPSRDIADKIVSDIEAMLVERHNTAMLITWEDVSE